ncbi:MAG: S8 family serine peptidase, partial [Melioribacteraceae bacterium]|nr:S8 family serine peptidase [Melioribacteraceae bacterium]
MKKLLTITFLFLTFGILHSQNKYLVYFKDKGSVQNNSLSKTSQAYLTAINQLSDKSIERRKKLFGDDFIDYKDIPLNQYYVDIFEELSIEIIWELKWFNAVSCRLNNEQLDKIIELPFVEKIDKVKTLKYKKGIEETVNNILPKQKINQYNHDYGPSLTQAELSDIPLVHDLGFTGQEVLIGILDAGFAWQNHPSLKDANVIAEHDFVYGDSLTGNDGDASHGTAVFSLIGGFDEGNLIGPSFNSNYILAKTEDIFSETHTEEDNYAAALEWMEALGADITTSSLGYSTFDAGEGSYTYEDMDGKTTIVTQASEIAFQKGVLCITSAGNEGNKPWKYITAPADGFNTIAIGAVTTVNRLAPFSSVGPSYDGRLKPELVAQGYSCYKAVAFTEGYNFGNGTSYSGPIAAGIAGQLLSAFPYLTNTQMRSILFESGDNVEDPNNERGYGLISSLRAVTFPNLKEEDGNYIINKI